MDIPFEGDSVAGLWSGPCRAREEHETCFEGPDCVEEGFQAHDITSRVLWSPITASFGLVETKFRWVLVVVVQYSPLFCIAG